MLPRVHWNLSMSPALLPPVLFFLLHMFYLNITFKTTQQKLNFYKANFYKARYIRETQFLSQSPLFYFLLPAQVAIKKFFLAYLSIVYIYINIFLDMQQHSKWFLPLSILKVLFFYIHLFIWQHQVLVAAWGISDLCCGT